MRRSVQRRLIAICQRPSGGLQMARASEKLPDIGFHYLRPRIVTTGRLAKYSRTLVGKYLTAKCQVQRHKEEA